MDFALPSLPAEVAGLSLTNAVFLAIGAIIFIGLAIFLIGMLKKVVENTILGLVVLFAINFLGGSLGFNIPLNLVTVLASAIFGLAGVGVLILLKLLGVNF